MGSISQHSGLQELALDNKIRSAIRAIAADLAKDDSPSGLELGSGVAGQALFFLHIRNLLPTHDWRPHLEKRVDQIFDEFPSAVRRPGLYSGVSGIAWFIEHLASQMPEASMPDDACDDVNEFLDGYLSRYPSGKDYDLINGLVGIGVYALSSRNAKAGKHLLSKVLARLRDSAEFLPNACRWPSPAYLMRDNPATPYNLGLAHGVPGVISLLALALRHDPAVDCASLLVKAVSWVRQNALADTAVSCYSAWAGDTTPMRLAWCYGDLGIATSLLIAGTSLGDDEIVAAGSELAQKSAERALGTCMVVDGCLCHGSAGIAHIFNRLYLRSRSPVYAKATAFWLAHLLSYRVRPEGVGGFMSYDVRRAAWLRVPGFLEGSAGIGLAMVSAIREPRGWDDVLLTSTL